MWNKAWGNPDDANKALSMTGSSYQVPFDNNPVNLDQDRDFQNDVRRQIATNNGMKAGAEAGGADGAPKGGVAGGMLGGVMGGGGGGGGGGGLANAGGKPYQSPPVGETQAQMIERQFALRNAAEKQRKEQLFSLVGKVFGF